MGQQRHPGSDEQPERGLHPHGPSQPSSQPPPYLHRSSFWPTLPRAPLPTAALPRLPPPSTRSPDPACRHRATSRLASSPQSSVAHPLQPIEDAQRIDHRAPRGALGRVGVAILAHDPACRHRSISRLASSPQSAIAHPLQPIEDAQRIDHRAPRGALGRVGVAILAHDHGRRRIAREPPGSPSARSRRLRSLTVLAQWSMYCAVHAIACPWFVGLPLRAPG